MDIPLILWEVVDIKQHIANELEYRSKEIFLKNISSLIKNGTVYKAATDKIITYAKDLNIDLVIGMESRGFIFGCPVSYALGIGFIPVRKLGTLVGFDDENIKDILTINNDAIKPGQRVLITDDVLTTGRTIEAIIKLVEEAGGIISGIVFLVELTDLDGRKMLDGYDVLVLGMY
ncbi:adenine phosphoribosyltransferase (plasmid) [Bacillus tropicus]|uniref:adenine phosphoribosyltransferase n=1 Tax=Bacillus shihchuchen TaxID=3036942 RepID=A0ABT7KZ41_9BACI|nr:MULTISPECIES: adenine phosphoribosyltransferase [Bacillus]MDL2419397.1 adenine phosphoribosyltransferase [Bacillus shihchuchen]WBO93179.1 adenine phosphoribosyltransferase [Bacillus tropicus]